jgi:WD40 repeat protein
MALEYLSGGSLSDRLERTGRLDPKAAAELVGTLAGAVQAAHGLGIVHRDLKPSNVLYDERGTPKVTDFGLAKRAGGSDLTATQAVMGTPAYMAPEQARGETKFVGPQADVYSLGVILYECLTGTKPFQAPEQLALLRRVAEEEPERPGKRAPGLPRDVELICLKCLAKDPAERYATAGALAAELGRFAAGEPVSVRAAGLVERVAKWARRKPTLAAAYTLGLLATLLGGLGGAAVWQWRATERARSAAESARREAVRARDGETKARERLAAVEYGRAIQVAYQEWRESNVPAAVDLLQGTRSDLRGWEWRYVDRLCHSDLLTLKGHLDFVRSASFSPDGSQIVTGSRDKTAKVWDARNGAEVLTLKGHNGFVYSASFSRDGSRVVTGSGDSTAKLWDAKSGAEVLTLKGHTGRVHSASFSPDGSRIVTGSQDKTAKVWDADTGAEVLTLKGHAELVNSASFSADGSRIVTGSQDKMAKVWGAYSGAEVLTLNGHTGVVSSASFSPDGSRIVTGSGDKFAKVWDANSGAEILTLNGHTGAVSSASFTPDGRWVVTGSFDKTAKLWDATTGAEVITLKGHTGVVHSASLSPDGLRVVTGSSDKTAKVWDATSAVEGLTLKGHTGAVWSASFSPDGSRVVTGSSDETAEVWDATSGAEVITLKGHTERVHSASFSPDGSWVVTGSFDKTAKVWDATTGAEVLTLKGHTDGVSWASFSPDGSRVVTGSGDKTAKVWDATTGAEVLTLKGHIGTVYSASFSPDGSRIVTGSSDTTAKVWDAASGAEVIMLLGHTETVYSASFSPDGSWVVTGSYDKTAKVWDATSGAEVITLKGHTGYVSSASFSPDASRVLTGSQDKTAKVWDATSGAEVLTLKGHTDGVRSSSFSPDGSRVVTGSWDNTAKVWDARPLTPEVWAMRAALGIVESLFAQKLPLAEVINRIRHNSTIGPEVRDRALALAEPQGRVFGAREIQHLVQTLFDRLLLREDVVESLRGDATLSGPVQAQALALAEHYPQDARRLNGESWLVVKRPGEQPAAYLRALHLAEAACRIDSNDGPCLNTLGIAEYRLGRYQAALATLTRSDQLNSQASAGSVPEDLVFLAMAHFRLGELDKADDALGRLREAMKKPRWANDAEAQAFLREVEEIKMDLAFPAEPFAR